MIIYKKSYRKINEFFSYVWFENFRCLENYYFNNLEKFYIGNFYFKQYEN